MSDDEFATPATSVANSTVVTPRVTFSDSSHSEKIKAAIESLSSVVPSLPPSLSFSPNPTFSLLHDTNVCSRISALLRQPNSGSGDNNLCRWLYDTFQTSIPDLQLIILRFLPTIAGIYLSRIAERKPQAGFEAVLLALYAHETTARAGQAVTINIPDLSNPSVYHEAKAPAKTNSTELNMAVISPSLEPHGTVRSTRRARIVGVALELYYTKISQMPIASKIDFCEFCKIWAGQDGEMYKEGDQATESGLKQIKDKDNGKIVTEEGKKITMKEGRIPLPWELLQPALRILGHCLMGPNNVNRELFEVACEACRCLYARSLHDINPKAILATGSLLRLSKTVGNKVGDSDPTELPMSNVISL